MNCALHAKAIVDALGKNYANLQTVVKICQLFISELSTVIDSTNQILIPGAGIMERRHQWNVYRLPCALPSPPGRYRFIPFALDCTWPAISKGSLFAGYDRKVVFPKFVLIKPWSRQNPFLFLKIQVSNEIFSFEMHWTDQRTPRRLIHLSFAPFTFTKSTHRFLRFFASKRSSLNKIGITWSIIPPVSLLSCYINFSMHLAGNFSDYFLSLSHKYK